MKSTATPASTLRGKRRGDGPIRFRTHFRNTIYDVLKERPGWVETESETDWDFMWNERDIAYETFDTMHLDAWQRINHFRNGRELCRKDLLAKNIKRHKRGLEKEGKLEEAARFDFTPITFILPGDYALFVEEFKKPQHAGALWIMKPIARSQGKGIFLFNKLAQITQWKSEYRWKPENAAVEVYVVQKYLAAPYLVGGKKFDLRVYALVTNYAPLTVWVYRSGFTRFSASRYSTDDFMNTFVHLTNVAVQKGSADYNPDFGGKWEIGKLKAYIACKHGYDAANALFADIQGIMLRSLFAVQKALINDPHCFELYGYDILIDEGLKPWLLEVNASPSMSASTRDDYDLKYKLLNDTLDIVDLEGRFSGPGALPLPQSVGGFDLVWKDGPVGSAATGAMPFNPSAAVTFGAPVPAGLASAAAVMLAPAAVAFPTPAPASTVAAAGAGGPGGAAAAGDESPLAGAGAMPPAAPFPLPAGICAAAGAGGMDGCPAPATDASSSSSTDTPRAATTKLGISAAVSLTAPTTTTAAAPVATTPVPLYGGAGIHGSPLAVEGAIEAMEGGGSKPVSIHSCLMGAEFDRRVNVWPSATGSAGGGGGAGSGSGGGSSTSAAAPSKKVTAAAASSDAASVGTPAAAASASGGGSGASSSSSSSSSSGAGVSGTGTGSGGAGVTSGVRKPSAGSLSAGGGASTSAAAGSLAGIPSAGSGAAGASVGRPPVGPSSAGAAATLAAAAGATKLPPAGRAGSR